MQRRTPRAASVYAGTFGWIRKSIDGTRPADSSHAAPAESLPARECNAMAWRCIEPSVREGIVTMILAGAFALTLAGCGDGDSGAGDGRDGAPASVPTTREEPPAKDEAPQDEAAQNEAAEEFAAEGWRTDFRRHSVPLREFMSGGPPKDGIPAVDRPRFVSVREAGGFLEPREPVIELMVEGETRAYPLQILVWHEIVNDEIGGVPVAVTFCPLCNTSIVFDRRVVGGTLDFGTTGKLRNADLVMYDRQTESWWQQIGGEGVAGRYTGERLRQLPARIVAWREFAREHEDGRVLSRETGHDRPYGRNPYEGYDDVSSPPFFPAENLDDDRLSPKERVVFVETRGEAVAVPYSTLARRKTVQVELNGRELVVRWRGGVASALDADAVAGGRDVGAAEVTEGGKPVAFSEPFWFAVAAFRPDVRIVR
jgi:hypothetical protein